MYGNLVPIFVRSVGLGGGIHIRFGCNGCRSKQAVFETYSKYKPAERSNCISLSVQVAFFWTSEQDIFSGKQFRILWGGFSYLRGNTVIAWGQNSVLYKLGVLYWRFLRLYNNPRQFPQELAGFHLGGAKGGICPPLDRECPPLDFDFILPHSLVVDVAPP